MTPETIRDLSYTDFIGIINQWNVPPGAFSTLSRWSVYSELNELSNILELACTSGFSVRELALATGAKGTGIDISAASIKAAQANQLEYGGVSSVTYQVEDAYTFLPTEKYSHIILGAALRFFPDPFRLMERVIGEFLKDGGKVLASPFYITEQIPEHLVKKARKIFGITVTNEPYKEIMRPYKGLEVLYEYHDSLRQETAEELRHYCESTIERACEQQNITDKVLREAIFSRLYEIKEMSNELRPYQRYVVLVLRYRASTYPRRYVELF